MIIIAMDIIVIVNVPHLHLVRSSLLKMANCNRRIAAPNHKKSAHGGWKTV